MGAKYKGGESGPAGQAALPFCAFLVPHQGVSKENPERSGVDKG